MKKENGLIGFIMGTEYKYKQNIEIIGNRLAVVENIDSILEYTEESICLLVGKKYVTISGCSLQIDNYGDKCVCIKGKINKIVFE